MLATLIGRDDGTICVSALGESFIIAAERAVLESGRQRAELRRVGSRWTVVSAPRTDRRRVHSIDVGNEVSLAAPRITLRTGARRWHFR